jgi:hypothetical protein
MRSIFGMLLTGALAAGACNGSLNAGNAGGGGTSGGGGGAAGTVFTFEASVNRNVDVVFMIDNSPGMPALQTKLVAAASSYFDVLKNLPGGLPNIHLGIVSSSMGAGRNPSIDGCPQGGDQGVFQTKPLGQTCAMASLNAGQNFIINTNGQANYTGDIADLFSCLAPLGSGGCGFEHQLESVLRALGADGAAAPAQNASFLRSDAYLQVILFSDEDDCSAPPDSDLFDSTSVTVTDPLGPLTSYRCNEFGHLCGGKKPPRQPAGETDLGTCVSAEDGRLYRVKDVVTALKTLKANPNKVFVSAISGPPTPYKVNVGPSEIKGDTSMWPFVERSCIQTEAGGAQTGADPAVRISQFVTSFGANGVFEDMCSGSFAPAMQAIAEQIGNAMGAPCLPASVDAASCKWVDHATDAQGQVTSTPLRQCTDSSDTGPCWLSAQGNNTVCPSGQLVHFTRPGAPVSTDLYTTATCK